MCGCSNHINGCVGAHCTCEGNCKECRENAKITDEDYTKYPKVRWSKVEAAMGVLLMSGEEAYEMQLMYGKPIIKNFTPMKKEHKYEYRKYKINYEDGTNNIWSAY